MGDFATEAIGLGMGLVNGAIQDSRQLKQNAKLRKQNMVYDKQWARFQQGLQMENWEATGYVGQRDQMMRAGINPALMYGMGGGGAQTMGAAPQQSGSPDVGHSEMGMGMQNAMQLALLQAQKDNIKAQTDKTVAETRVAEGQLPVQAETVNNMKAATEKLKQEYDNLREDWVLKRYEQAGQLLDNALKSGTMDEQINQMKTATEQMRESLDILKNQGKISDATWKDQITTIRANALDAALQPLLTRESINLSKEQQKAIAQGVLRDWDKFSMDKGSNSLDNILKGANIELTEQQKMNLLHGMDFIIGNLKATK